MIFTHSRRFLPQMWHLRHKIAAKAVRLGTVEAPDEATAIEKGAAESKVPANRLMVIGPRAEAAAINAMANGSQHKTMSAISNRMARPLSMSRRR
jgi:hypothetical protein